MTALRVLLARRVLLALRVLHLPLLVRLVLLGLRVLLDRLVLRGLRESRGFRESREFWERLVLRGLWVQQGLRVLRALTRLLLVLLGPLVLQGLQEPILRSQGRQDRLDLLALLVRVLLALRVRQGLKGIKGRLVLQDRLVRPGHPVVKEIRDPLVLREQLGRLARLVTRDRQALRVRQVPPRPLPDLQGQLDLQVPPGLTATAIRPLAPQA